MIELLFCNFLFPCKQHPSKDELQNLGFNFNMKDNGNIEMTGVPSDVKIGNENKIFQELIDQFKEILP